MNHAEFLESLTAWSQTDRGIRPENMPPTALWAWERGQRKLPPDKRPQWCVRTDSELRCGCRCPITYLANKEHGSGYGLGEWEQAAEELGLEDGYKIVDAADGVPGFDRNLRRQLLVAVGIIEPKEGGR